MNGKIDDINKLFVEIFNNIKDIEEKSLSHKDISDISITEIHAIEAIGINSEKTMSEIAQNLNITLGTLTSCINKLIKKGYVERKRTEEDRRVVLVKLTEKGKNAYNYHKEFHHDMVNNTIKTLKDDETKILISSLEKLKEFFIEKYNM
ncbi:MarR family winged helix-turn-helix transcriptional regulator [uncultured Clostridium sp.]|uniref:MarR family winged helix-turn-helix transcriptional regulator n=1 Tax=uncultured Clostridium sp. TaxID=59620 RepID=UPI0025D6E227|nr:winged helix DNA-binding protein [uncultured Clostridium sp.]